MDELNELLKRATKRTTNCRSCLKLGEDGFCSLYPQVYGRKTNICPEHTRIKKKIFHVSSPVFEHSMQLNFYHQYMGIPFSEAIDQELEKAKEVHASIEGKIKDMYRFFDREPKTIYLGDFELNILKKYNTKMWIPLERKHTTLFFMGLEIVPVKKEHYINIGI